MRLKYKELVYWKTEHTRDDNEDAWGKDLSKGIFAVADGVGESSFAEEWAPHVVRRFVVDPLLTDDPFEVERWVRITQHEAREGDPEGNYERMTPLETLSGIALQVARRGAAATLLGLVIEVLDGGQGAPMPSYSYHLIAIGDSNFFHWRPIESGPDNWYELKKTFPIENSSSFGTLPDSINSRFFDRYSTRPIIFGDASDPDLILRDGDVLMLATDAVAQWILRANEDNVNPVWGLLEQTEKGWSAFIEQMRGRKRMVNDDATLLIIQVESVSEGAPLVPLSRDVRQEQRSKELWDLMGQYNEEKSRDIDLALAFGDGNLINDKLKKLPYVTPAIWKERADAYKIVSDAVQVVLLHPERKGELAEAWAQYHDLLIPLHWTQELVTTLRTMGIEPAAEQPVKEQPVVQPQPQIPVQAIAQPVIPQEIEATPTPPIYTTTQIGGSSQTPAPHLTEETIQDRQPSSAPPIQPASPGILPQPSLSQTDGNVPSYTPLPPLGGTDNQSVDATLQVQGERAGEGEPQSPPDRDDSKNKNRLMDSGDGMLQGPLMFLLGLVFGMALLAAILALPGLLPSAPNQPVTPSLQPTAAATASTLVPTTESSSTDGPLTPVVGAIDTRLVSNIQPTDTAAPAPPTNTILLPTSTAPPPTATTEAVPSTNTTTSDATATQPAQTAGTASSTPQAESTRTPQP
jgi:hypothetical protein